MCSVGAQVGVRAVWGLFGAGGLPSLQITPLLLLRGGPGLSEGLLVATVMMPLMLLLTGQRGVGLQDPIPSSAGERNTFVQTARPAAPQVVIFLSQNQRVCPGYGIPITLRTSGSTRAFASRRWAMEPGLASAGLTGKHHSWPLGGGGVSSREMKWGHPHLQDSPRQDTSWSLELPGRAPAAVCERQRESRLQPGWVGGGRLGALGRPLCPCVAAGAWMDLF